MEPLQPLEQIDSRAQTEPRDNLSVEPVTPSNDR